MLHSVSCPNVMTPFFMEKFLKTSHVCCNSTLLLVICVIVLHFYIFFVWWLATEFIQCFMMQMMTFYIISLCMGILLIVLQGVRGGKEVWMRNKSRAFKWVMTAFWFWGWLMNWRGKNPSDLLSLCLRGNRNSSELRAFIHSDLKCSTTDRADQRLTD